MVKNRYQKKPSLLLRKMYACAIVMVTPEVSNSKVLTNGKPQTFNGCVPSGGQIAPTEIDGTRLK